MGYNIGTLVKVFELVEAGRLSRGARIFDLGSQDAFLTAEWMPLLHQRIGEVFPELGAKVFEPTALTFPVRELFEFLGFHYVCTDVDRRPGTMYVDLHWPVLDPQYVESFDLVCNHGTSEHVLDVIKVFATLHALAKPGGLIWHTVPCYGLGNHGFVNLTPKFWAALISVNRYAPLMGKVSMVSRDVLDLNQFYMETHDFLEGAREAADLPAAMTQLIVRKPDDAIFFPPLDFYDWTSSITADMVWASVRSYCGLGAWSLTKTVADVNAHLAGAGAAYRVRASSWDDAVMVPKGPFHDQPASVATSVKGRVQRLMRWGS